MGQSLEKSESTGLTGDLAEFLRDPIGFMIGLYQAQGTKVFFVKGQSDFAFAFGPDHNKELLSQPDLYHSTGFLFPGPKNSPQRRLLSGLFSMNGEQHKRHRRLLMPPFQKKAIEGYRDQMVVLADEVLAGWQPGQVRDMSREMINLSLRITSKILFGFDDLDTARAIDDIVEEWLGLNSLVAVAGSLSIACPKDSYNDMLKDAQRLESHFRTIIAQRNGSAHGNDVLSLLIKTHREDQTRMSDVALVGQATHFFAAANHTTKDALTWTLFLLAEHPEVMADLVDELGMALHGEPPTVEQLAQLPLLERVIKESMRLLPPVVYYSRTNVEPANLGQYPLRKGTTIVFSHYITHHMADLYPEPEKFLPDRWLNLNPSPYAYLPFGAGPRMCIGAPFAMMTLKITLAMILQRFRLAMVPESVIDRRVTTTLWSKYGIPMVIWAQDRRFSSSPVRGNIHEMVDLRATMDAAATAA